MTLNRREFLELSAGAVSATALLGVGATAVEAARQSAPTLTLPEISSTFGGVPLGCASTSFQNPIEDIPDMLKRIGYGMVEITSTQLEPQINASGRGGNSQGAIGSTQPSGQTPVQANAGGRGVPGAGPSRATDPEGRAKLLDWRLHTPISYFEGIGKLFQVAGIYVHAYNAHFGADITDEELDRAFQVTRAMTARVVTAVCPPTNDFAKRLDPIARKNNMRVGIHNTSSSYLENEAAWDELLDGCSDYVGINLDIGFYANAGANPADLVRNKKDLILDIHLNTHLRASPGDAGALKVPPVGNTTVSNFLTAMRDNKWVIPCNVEDEMRRPDKLTAMAVWFGYCEALLGA